MFKETNVSTWAFEGRAIEEALPAIEQLGFKSVEIWADNPSHFDPASKESVLQLQGVLSTSTIRPDALHAPFGRPMDISNPDPSARRRAVEALLKCLETTSSLPLNAMVIHPGHIMGPGEEPKRYEAATESLEKICQRGEDLAVEICVENLLSDRDHPVFCDTLPKTLHLLRSVEGVSPSLCVDTSHGNIMGNLPEEIEICGEVVHRTHISDNFGTRDDHLPPGDGEIDWKAVVTSLRRISYSGPLTLEVAGRGNPEETLNRARDSLAHILSDWGP